MIQKCALFQDRVAEVQQRQSHRQSAGPDELVPSFRGLGLHNRLPPAGELVSLDVHLQYTYIFVSGLSHLLYTIFLSCFTSVISIRLPPAGEFLPLVVHLQYTYDFVPWATPFAAGSHLPLLSHQFLLQTGLNNHLPPAGILT